MIFCHKSRHALCISTLHLLVILALGCAFTGRSIKAQAATPAEACMRTPTDDTVRPIPEDLAGEVNTAFGTSMPASVAVATTVYRCDNGRVQVCTVGADLPCGKADASRTPGVGMVEWCRENPDSTVIPAVVTGHATIFDWRCALGAPQIERQVLTVNARGFVSQYWKQLP